MGTKTVRKVGFTLGESVGKLLVDIAREHLLYSYDPDKAMSTITESLGCETDIALKILKGDILLITTEDGKGFNGVPYDPAVHSEMFPLMDIERWAERKLLQMKEDAKGWNKSFREFKRAIARRWKFNFSVEYDVLLKYFYDGSTGNLIKLDDGDIASDIKNFIVAVKNFLSESSKTLSVVEWLYKSYPGYIPDGFIDVPYEVRELNLQLFKLISGDDKAELGCETSQMNAIDNYLNSEKEIQKVLDKGIKPVDILQNWSAGWLSPTGDYYALNGEKANMLHNQIADALVDAKLITPKKDVNGITETPERWLEEQGWAKIHGDWILYDGWNLPRVSKEPVPMTKEQKKKIYEYGQVCCGGVLMLGHTRERISAARFDMTELPMLKRYFEV